MCILDREWEEEEEEGENERGQQFETRGNVKAKINEKGRLMGWCSWELGGIPVES